MPFLTNDPLPQCLQQSSAMGASTLGGHERDVSAIPLELSVSNFRGNGAQCPNCGQIASVIDGLIQPIQNGIRILSAPDWTYDALDRLRHILEQAQAGQIPADELHSKVSAISPALAAIFDHLKSHTDWLSLFVAMLFGILTQLQGSQPTTVNNYYQQITVVAKGSGQLLQSATPLSEQEIDHLIAAAGRAAVIPQAPAHHTPP